MNSQMVRGLAGCAMSKSKPFLQKLMQDANELEKKKKQISSTFLGTSVYMLHCFMLINRLCKDHQELTLQ